jgi:hypothetical protein
MKIVVIGFLSLVLVSAVSCRKKAAAEDPVVGAYNLSYGDSLFFIKSTPEVISPKMQQAGTYTAFPENLNMDPATGNITLSVAGKDGINSQTGLRYRITFEGTTGTRDTAYIVIAGINYQDRVYTMTQSDPYIYPIYNGDPSLPAPAGTYTADDNDLAITGDGRIQFKQSVYDLFGTPLKNGDYEDIEIDYKPANSTVTNRIKILIYYYDNVNTVHGNVSKIMSAHQDMLLGIPKAPITITSNPDLSDPKGASLTKPRPPCIIIVGH